MTIAASQDPQGCRYIHGDVPGADWHYCNRPTVAGSAYCADHHAACHLPPATAAAHLRMLMAMVDRLDAGR